MNYSRRRASSHVSTVSNSFSNQQSQWELLMRKFSQDCKRADHYCAKILSQGEKLMFKLSKEFQKSTHLRSNDGEPMKCESRPLKRFSTGSTYEGTWDALGMCGYGIYTFPNGVVYRGEFDNNMFHGDGEMRYPDGIKLRGKWNYGELIDRTLIFEDGVHYSEKDWMYCKEPDRRFSREIKEGIQPAGNSNMSNDNTFRELKDGTYDVGDGIYDPKTGVVNDYIDHTKVLRFVNDDLKLWIEENCRKAPNSPVGPKPELYKQWLDATLKATIPPTCEYISDEESEQNDIYSNENFSDTSSTIMKCRTSLSSYIKRSKLKFNRNKPQVDF